MEPSLFLASLKESVQKFSVLFCTLPLFLFLCVLIFENTKNQVSEFLLVVPVSMMSQCLVATATAAARVCYPVQTLVE